MRASRFAKFLPAGWLIILALFGGASRYDEWQQIVVILFSAGLLLTASWTPDWSDMRAKRPLWLFLAAVATTIALQLVPLPPEVWTRLPGREPFVLGARLTGLDHNWRPFSLTPDLTWGSLFSLLPVAATLAVAPTTLSPALRPLLWTMIAIFTVATLLGLAQSLGADGLTTYRQTNIGSAVGVFANRNHHAIFLALAFPVVAYLVATQRSKAGSNLSGGLVGASLAALYTVAIVQAGSRLGLVLSALMLSVVLTAIALNYFPMAGLTRSRRESMGVISSNPRRATLPGLVAVAAVVALVLIVSRSVAFERVVQFDVTYDSRTRILPVLTKMAETFAPFGSGYGSFATVFRHFEPFEMLRFTYLNQAHNDVVQILIEGGIVGATLMAVAAFALIWQAIRIARAPQTTEQMVGVVGCSMVAILFVASLADYPLRTPLLAGMLVFAAVFILRPDGAFLEPNAKSRLPSRGSLPRGARALHLEEFA